MVMTGRVRVAIADDYTLFREGLASLLQREDDLEVVGMAVNAAEVLPILRETQPDVLILDLLMPELGGLAILPEIRECSASTRVLVSNPCDQEQMFLALCEGVRGCVPKTASSADLVKAIKAVHAGEAWLERGVMGRLLERLPRRGRNPVRSTGPSRVLTLRLHGNFFQ